MSEPADLPSTARTTTSLPAPKVPPQSSPALPDWMWDHLGEGVALVDAAGRILRLNPAAAALLDAGPGDALPGDPAPDGCREFEFLHPRDGARMLEIRSRSVPWNGATARLCVLRDVTARRRIEEEDRRLYADTSRHARQLAELAVRLSRQDDEQRRRLAQDIHDSVGQTLSVVKMTLMQGADAAGPDAARATLARAAEVLDTVIGQVRTMTFELYPALLDDLGLMPALYWLAERHGADTRLRIEITETGLRTDLPADQRRFLFRAARELLTNVAKHAGARVALLSVQWGHERVRLQVADDGLGFDRTERGGAADSLPGLGLVALRERVRAMGGTLAVDSRPGWGSQVELVLPVPAPG